MNKIFEVGISESLQEQVRHLNLDIVEKVSNCCFNCYCSLCNTVFLYTLTVSRCELMCMFVQVYCRHIHALQQSWLMSMNWLVISVL